MGRNIRYVSKLFSQKSYCIRYKYLKRSTAYC